MRRRSEVLRLARADEAEADLRIDNLLQVRG
jgi:hypothetical protein